MHPYQDSFNYNNDKSWCTAKLRQLSQAKDDARRNGDRVLYKQAKYTLEKTIRVAKRNYSDKLRNKFSSSDSASVWKGIKDITSYKTPSPSTVENQQLADDLNEFYCRFEKTPHPHTKHLSTHAWTPPATWTKITGLNDYRPVALMSLNHLKDLSEGHHWTLTGPPAVCPQSKQVCGWWDCTSSCSIWTDQGLMRGSVCRLQLCF